MERKVFLEKNRSKFSVNAPNAMGVDLDTKSKLMQDSGIFGNFSELDQYNKERDECGKFRMIFCINPICSNVLFNMQTEVVQNEGSSNPLILGEREISPTSITRSNGFFGNYIVNTSSIRF